MSDNPYPLPAPSIVADLCSQRAWDDAVDDDTRLRLEFAADTIRLLMRRCVYLAQRNERLEAVK